MNVKNFQSQTDVCFNPTAISVIALEGFFIKSNSNVFVFIKL